jgi:hypothetical protein
MTVIINGTAGITFPDGTIQTDGLVTPVPVADGGTGSTSTTYCSLTTNVTGTLPVANGGTGAATLTANNVLLGNGTSALQAVAPGSNGNILTSNGTTWQSTAPAGGGVTSLNGQTGAITNTSLYAIGSYVTGRPQNTDNYAVDSTIAGSSLYGCTPAGFYDGAWGECSSGGTGNGAGQTLINTGTWRCVSTALQLSNARALAGLWVRIS